MRFKEYYKEKLLEKATNQSNDEILESLKKIASKILGHATLKKAKREDNHYYLFIYPYGGTDETRSDNISFGIKDSNIYITAVASAPFAIPEWLKPYERSASTYSFGLRVDTYPDEKKITKKQFTELVKAVKEGSNATAKRATDWYKDHSKYSQMD